MARFREWVPRNIEGNIRPGDEGKHRPPPRTAEAPENHVHKFRNAYLSARPDQSFAKGTERSIVSNHSRGSHSRSPPKERQAKTLSTFRDTKEKLNAPRVFLGEGSPEFLSPSRGIGDLKNHNVSISSNASREAKPTHKAKPGPSVPTGFVSEPEEPSTGASRAFYDKKPHQLTAVAQERAETPEVESEINVRELEEEDALFLTEKVNETSRREEEKTLLLDHSGVMMSSYEGGIVRADSQASHAALVGMLPESNRKPHSPDTEGLSFKPTERSF